MGYAISNATAYKLKLNMRQSRNHLLHPDVQQPDWIQKVYHSLHPGRLISPYKTHLLEMEQLSTLQLLRLLLEHLLLSPDHLLRVLLNGPRL